MVRKTLLKLMNPRQPLALVMNITGTLTAAGSGAGAVGVGVGGFGGDGGASGAVDGTLTGNITTAGDDSYGALLQSLGGGGGNGGLNVTAGVTMSSSGSGTLGVGVGGFGGLGGEASTVTGNITGDVSTNGSDAFGVMVLQAAMGQSSYETQRLIDVTESYLAEADNDVVFLSGLVGFVDRRDIGRYRFESGVDFGYAHLKGNALSEIGASEQNLVVDGRSDNYFWVTPSVEVSTGSLFANNVNWEVFGRVGVQHYISDPNTTSIGRLAGGPVDVAGMQCAREPKAVGGVAGVVGEQRPVGCCGFRP